MRFFVSVSLVAAVASCVRAWSGLEHQMAGRIAEHFLDAETVAELQVLLNDTNGSLSLATTWADAVKATPLYKWSAISHYIDAEDVTPGDGSNQTIACNVNMTRDCADGRCIVQALLNYTERVDVHARYGAAARVEAAKFLSHYIGDITQPLHNCGRAIGGNTHLVKWNGSIYEPPPYNKFKHNLHFIWDQFMIEADIQLNYNNNATKYVEAIVQDIRTGIWSSHHRRWTHCDTPFVNKISGRVCHSCCPQEWSSDANDYNCETVWYNVGNGSSSDDLFLNGYYDKNKDVARLQLAKAGLRMATVFNSLVPNNGRPTNV